MENKSKINFINQSEMNFKIQVDNEFVGTLSSLDRCSVSLAKGNHSVKLLSIPKMRLLKFAGWCFVNLIGNLVSEGSSDFLKSVSEYLTRYEITAEFDVPESGDVIVGKQLDISFSDGKNEIIKNQHLEKRVDKLWAATVLAVYILPIFLLLFLASIVLICIAINIMMKGNIKEAITVIICAIVLWLIIGYVWRRSKRIRAIVSIIKSTHDNKGKTK